MDDLNFTNETNFDKKNEFKVKYHREVYQHYVGSSGTRLRSLKQCLGFESCRRKKHGTTRFSDGDQLSAKSFADEYFVPII